MMIQCVAKGEQTKEWHGALIYRCLPFGRLLSGCRL
jgi:hypothetical protein